MALYHSVQLACRRVEEVPAMASELSKFIDDELAKTHSPEPAQESDTESLIKEKRREALVRSFLHVYFRCTCTTAILDISSIAQDCWHDFLCTF